MAPHNGYKGLLNIPEFFYNKTDEFFVATIFPFLDYSFHLCLQPQDLDCFVDTYPMHNGIIPIFYFLFYPKDNIEALRHLSIRNQQVNPLNEHDTKPTHQCLY